MKLLQAIEATVIADKLAHCCQEFRVLACPNGHRWNPVPMERCGYRLCPDCAMWRQARAFRRIFPAIQELKQRYPTDRWVLITLTARSTDESLLAVATRFKGWLAKLRRTEDWQRCIRAGIVGFEVLYHPGKGWHFHAHILASRKAWWGQAELAASWQRVTKGQGESAGRIVDIRDKDADVRAGMCETLKYPFKPTNLLKWGPEQVRQFNELGRMKLSECYGAMRGLVGDLEDDGDDQLGMEPEELPLVEGQACPDCGLPLTAQWLSREALYGGCDGIDSEPIPPPTRPGASWAHREAASRAHKPHVGV